ASMLAPSARRPHTGFSPGHRPGLANFENGLTNICFDLRKPLAPQLARAKDYLSRLQQELVGGVIDARHHKGKWALYLRTIDARDAAATWEQIFDVLLTEKKNTVVDI